MVSNARTEQDAAPTYVSDQHSDTIDALYQHALSQNPSVKNQVAYAGYLASHGRSADGLRQLRQLMQLDSPQMSTATRDEINKRIIRIETQLADGPLCTQSLYGD